MTKLRLWPCKDIDFAWCDVAYALRMCVSTGKSRLAGKSLLDSETQSIVCISVRSAFDLYLTSRGWGRKDECLFVGLNVPDMYRLAARRGLRVVGVDIDPCTTEVDMLQLQEKISKNTRFIVVSHLFGYRYRIDKIIELANGFGIDVVEDCAQAFAGSSWSGSEGATLSLFSFGPMKTATALQGAIAIVREPALQESMNRLLITYPTQPTWRYCARILWFSAMKAASHPLIYALIVNVLRIFRVDHEALIHTMTKSTDVSRWLRMKPCDALIRVIQHRVANTDADMARRYSKGSQLIGTISRTTNLVIRDQQPNAFWMVPVLVRDPERFKNVLRSEGFDAVSGRLEAVKEEVDTEGTLSLANAVMLPFSPRIPNEELQRLGYIVNLYAESESQMELSGEYQRS